MIVKVSSIFLLGRSHSESGHFMDSHQNDMTASFSSANGQYGYGDRTAPPPEIPPRSPARAGYPPMPQSSVPAPIHPPDNGVMQGKFNGSCSLLAIP